MFTQRPAKKNELIQSNQHAPRRINPPTQTLVKLFAVATVLLMASAATPVFATANGSIIINFQWTDRVGTVHPLAQNWTTGYEDDSPATAEFAGSGFTSAHGVVQYNATDLAPLDSQTEFYGSIDTRTGAGTTEWFRVQDTTGALYSSRWPTSGTWDVADPPASLNKTFTFNNTTWKGAAHGITQFAGFMHNYYATKHNATIPWIPIEYDSTTSASFYATPNNTKIQIDAQDWASSDVIMHEYAHHIQANNGLTASPGGNHNIDGDNIRGTGAPAALGVLPGSRLAWGEGLATYMGISAIQDGNMSTKANLAGLPATDYDSFYNDYSPALASSTATDFADLDFAIDLESNRAILGGTIAGTYTNVPGLGEGSENVISHVLWDLYDSTNENQHYKAHGTTLENWALGKDRVSYGADTVWDKILTGGGGDGTANTSMQECWDDLTTFAGTTAGQINITDLVTTKKEEATAALGEIMGEAGISAIPLVVADPSLSKPQFFWTAQNNANSKYFRILLYNDDWSSVAYDSGQQILAQYNNYTELAIVSYTSTTNINPGTYNWVMLNSPAIYNTNPAGLASDFDWYWSGAKSLTLIPEPTAAALWAITVSMTLTRRKGNSYS